MLQGSTSPTDLRNILLSYQDFRKSVFLFPKGSFRPIPKNGTSIHIAAPSQHKHKIKHDKTTMQSYLLCRGGISCLTYLYSHTHKKLYQAICIINNAPIRILFTRVLKKMKLRRLFNKKNGTPIHIAAPSQHKHKIKHDKTTMQSYLLCRGGISCLTYLYSHTHKKLYQVICIIKTNSYMFCS